MKKIWINKPNSFREAEKFDADYYLGMSPAERLETVQLLREEYSRLRGKSGGSRNENSKGLRKVFRVVK